MKRILALLMMLAIMISLCACGEKPESSAEKEPVEAASSVEEAAVEEPVEEKINYAEILPPVLQGIWVDTEAEGILSIYAFKGSQIETHIVTVGKGASPSFLTGTYTVGENRVDYAFNAGSGFSNFTYNNDTLILTNANGTELKKLSAADLMNYLTQEESNSNRDGVVCLADLIINYFADSPESAAALEKKEAISAAIQAEGQAALGNLNTTYDKIQKLTWYEHKNQPRYTDITCYMYPYIGRLDDGTTWLRVKLDYTDAQTDNGWIFFNNVIFSVDGENTAKSFSRNEIIRDNDTEVWEIADFEPDASDIQLLKTIAVSTETIIRFQGDEYYYDHTVTDNEKSAITDVLNAFDYLKNYAE